MKKRLIALLFVLIMICSVPVTASASSGSLNNFKVLNVYSSGRFSDVVGAAWYAMGVQVCYEYGLITGVSSDAFAPDASLTMAEAIKLADSLSSIYRTGKDSLANGSPWYRPYVNDALKKGIIAAIPSDPSAAVTRAEFAGMIARALPAAAFAAVSNVADNAIPDVALSDSFASDIYMLYRAGILTGRDSFGTFNPNAPLSRAEAAVIEARVSNTGFRKSVTLPKELSGKELYARCAPAVFYLERFDSENVLIGIGSGFFISSSGLAVTNYHVIADAASAVITTADGTQYAVKGICGYDKTMDIAILQIDGSGFNYLSIADSDQVSVGTHVYAIGSPFGLFNTVSDGIVSNARQALNNSEFIQYSAPISMGSGGGPVLNTKGQVVGISCLTVLSGQTLNFAVPINDLNGLSRTNSIPLISFQAKNNSGVIYYRSYFPVPDYGIHAGATLYKTILDQSTGVKTYYYKASDITVSDDVAEGGYVKLLNQNGFDWQSTYTNNGGYTVDVYYNASFDMSVHFGTDVLDGVVCRVVAIY
jgi:S1-C subfamily serine protease